MLAAVSAAVGLVMQLFLADTQQPWVFWCGCCLSVMFTVALVLLADRRADKEHDDVEKRRDGVKADQAQLRLDKEAHATREQAVQQRACRLDEREAQEEEDRGALQAFREREAILLGGGGVTAYLDPIACWITVGGDLRVAGYVVNGQPKKITLDKIELRDEGLGNVMLRVVKERSMGLDVAAGSEQEFSILCQACVPERLRAETDLSSVHLRLHIDCGGGVVPVDKRNLRAHIRVNQPSEEPPEYVEVAENP